MELQNRQQQFEKIKTIYKSYKPMIKIIAPNGATDWIRIDNSEMWKIFEILTGDSIQTNNFGEYVFSND